MCGFLIMIKITSRVWTFTYTSSECKCDVSSIDLIHLVVRNQVTSLGNVDSNLLRVLKKIYGMNFPSDAVKWLSDFTSGKHSHVVASCNGLSQISYLFLCIHTNYKIKPDRSECNFP